MQTQCLRYVKFYFSILIQKKKKKKKKSKREFSGINGDQAKSGFLTSHNLSKDKLRNIIYLLALFSVNEKRLYC